VLFMEYLFRTRDGYQFFKEKKEGITAEIDTLSKIELDSSDDSLKIILKAKHVLRLIEFVEPYRIDKGEIQINISNDHRFAAYFFRDDEEEGPVYKKGRRIEVHLPFSCDGELFKVHPSTFTTVFPRAEIRGAELIFDCDFFSDVDTPEQVNKKINEEIDLIKMYSNWLNGDISNFNSSIDSIIDDGLLKRREKLSRDEAFLKQIHVPQQDIIKTGFIKPEKKLDLKILKEDIVRKIEPSLVEETYDEIIEQVNSLGINLERSSQRLRELDEESLRDTILMALNSTYRGMSSGEAFNKEGKTDILIKYQDSILFIAECKIWRSDDYFLKGIDQLLSYLTWRDTKTSYIIFSKNRDVTRVIAQSKQLIQSHPNFIAIERSISDSCIKFRFKQKIGTSIECFVTLHVFDLGGLN
jgi:hypothetical protein